MEGMRAQGADHAQFLACGRKATKSKIERQLFNGQLLTAVAAAAEWALG
jgi:hypothetical protein